MSEPLPRLLLVEDEPVVRAFLVAALEGAALRLTVAASGADACRLAREQAPALVLLDLHLPDGEGVGVLRQLRTDGLRCPVVALTADGQARLEGALADAGFADVAHKPLQRDDLRQLVARWLPATRPAAAAGMVGSATPAPLPGGVAEPDVASRQPAEQLPDWDDAAALAALAGRAEILSVLRGLLREDLPAQLATVERSHADDPAAACAVLHRLQAAAAFCGAARLAGAARSLESTLLGGERAADALQALRRAAAAVLSS